MKYEIMLTITDKKQQDVIEIKLYNGNGMLYHHLYAAKEETKEAKITKKEFDNLFKKLETAGLYGLNETYSAMEEEGTDMSLRVIYEERVKTVVCHSSNCPDKLKIVVQEIREFANKKLTT